MDVSMVDPGGRESVDRGDGMREPDEVAAMIGLHRLGWGVRRIAAEIGCSHMTVRRYLAAGGPVVLIEEWRQHYNRVRPHSSLGYRPPAPETVTMARLGSSSGGKVAVIH